MDFRFKTTYLLIPPPYLCMSVHSLQRCHDDRPVTCCACADHYVINSRRDWLKPLTRYSRVLVDNRYPLVFRAPVMGEAVNQSDLRNSPWWQKIEWWAYPAYQIVKEFRWQVRTVLTQYTRVTDVQTTEFPWHIRATAYTTDACKNE